MIKLAIEEWGLYNSGFLACKWWGMDDDIEEIREFYINARREHNIEPYDDIELFNADYEAEYHGINFSSLLSEDISFEKCLEIHEELDKLHEYEIKKISFLMDVQGYSVEEALESYDDCQIYEDMNLEDLAYEFVEEGLFGEMSDTIKGYLDYEKLARDLGFDYTEFGSDVLRMD